MDVDAILPLSHISEYEENEQFWLAVERLNEELDSQGLYLTHLFVDNQVILRKNWLEMIQPIDIKELQNVKLFRPATEDLLLSKMMRVDPLDRADMRFLADQAGLTQKRFEELTLEAVVPPLPEIEVAFGQNKKWLLEIVLIETQQS
ncbi:hypothetical protein QQ056_18295 [Oscillatoria laete-virens NRMC-F 0139]|nr:hypothetical protein [Oscillatoria laete-virens NRMC-F 0139]